MTRSNRTTFGQKGVAIRVAKKMGLKEGEYEIKLVGKGQWEIVRKEPAKVEEPTVATESPAVADPGPTTAEPTVPTATEVVPVRKLEIVDYADQPKDAEAPVATTTAQPAPEATPKNKSTVPNPVRAVWAIADEMKAANPISTRKQVVDECVRRGIALYTARTQYQRWLTTRNGPSSP